jgi:hypothetical protein
LVEEDLKSKQASRGCLSEAIIATDIHAERQGGSGRDLIRARARRRGRQSTVCARYVLLRRYGMTDDLPATKSATPSTHYRFLRCRSASLPPSTKLTTKSPRSKRNSANYAKKWANSRPCCMGVLEVASTWKRSLMYSTAQHSTVQYRPRPWNNFSEFTAVPRCNVLSSSFPLFRYRLYN